MTADQLRALQTPVKERYKNDPASAVQTLRARGTLSADITCKIESAKAGVPAGLHPGTGGDGSAACSADMLLEALVGCAGVTLNAVATAMNIPIRKGTITAEGDLDFRGTLGVSKDAPVGFSQIRLRFDLDSDATPEQLNKLVQLTERYCVVFQTLQKPPRIAVSQSTSL
jgi:uncharacterized OsmC-like protein